MGLGMILGVIAGGIGYPIISSALGPATNAVTQAAFNKIPNSLLQPADLINARWRQLTSPSDYKHELRLLGINDERAELLFKSSEQLISGLDNITLFRRKIIGEDELYSNLMGVGYTEDRVAMLLRASEQVPTALDVIRFAVREVYTPEIAQQFGQYEDLERLTSAAADDLAATGITADAFSKYWAAHWQLPSAQQGFEMLHRGIIDSDTMMRLLVAADVMPFWREKMMAISFNPYTRVDTRRMQKLGIIDEAAVKKAYMDNGYDEEHATNLTLFTVKYNEGIAENELSAQEAKAIKETGMTKSLILEGYRDYLLTAQETIEYLMGIGESQSSAELSVAQEDFDHGKEFIATQTATIHDAYTRSIWDRNQAIAALGKLNLPGKKMDILMEKWDMEKQAKPSKPTKAELNAWFEKRFITEEVYRAELATMGYSAQYIDLYVRTEKTKVSK